MDQYPATARSAYPLMLPATTRWRDNDVYDHLNNVVYGEYFDTAVNVWLIRTSPLELPKGPVIGLVAETSTRFLSSVGFPDDLEIGLSTLRVGTSSVVYGLGLFRAGAEEASALCRFVHVYVNSETHRPTPLPDAFREALKELEPRG